MSGRKLGVFAVALCLALTGALEAQARAGSGGSFGSRGSKSFSTVPSTPTAPSVSPFGAQQNVGNQGLLRPSGRSPGMFGGFGRGLLGGLLGAGLIGLLFGSGFGGGLGGLMSILGLLLQIGLIFLLVRFAINFFRRPSMASAGPGPNSAFRTAPSGGFGGGTAPTPVPTAPLTIVQADYSRFEQTLVAVQTAYSNEDLATLRTLAGPAVVEQFGRELADNRARGVINRMSDIHFQRGDLAESWSEGGADFASVAMRYTLIDATIERASGRVVDGDANRPQQVTEVWTFSRPSGSAVDAWRLSAIQQAR